MLKKYVAGGGSFPQSLTIQPLFSLEVFPWKWYFLPVYMANKRVLLFYITESSGHHVAARAIETGVRHLDRAARVLSVDSFRFTNPILERVVRKTYLQVIKNTPEIWDWLYDNSEFKEGTNHFRKLIHKLNSLKLKKLIAEEKPDVIVCTQAFPCGTISDYKKTEKADIPLIAVVTDFAAHSYWIYDNVDVYIVPTVEVRECLIDHGIAREKVKVLGIPINPAFNETVDRDASRRHFGLLPDLPAVLIMGGGLGLGPIKDIVKQIDKIDQPFQIVVATGINRMLKRSLDRKAGRMAKPIQVLGYVHAMNELMSASDILVTKPGGLTTSEAFAMNLPLVIVNPIPGQETKNADFLIRKRAAVTADNSEMVASTVADLLKYPAKLKLMRENAKHLSRPDSALAIAREVLRFKHVSAAVAAE
jgi:processive 1,2-diacylglycerol beta-glucosyltransferase